MTANLPPAILSRGFRPFFLLAAVQAPVALLLWLAMQVGSIAPPGDWPGHIWHGHEMLFGYVGAVLGGFVLTAVPEWAPGSRASARMLGGFILLWLAGRVVMALPGALPSGLVGGIDSAFLPCLALYAGITLVRRRQWRNVVVLVPITLLAVTNIVSHLAVAEVVTFYAGDVLRVSIGLVALLIVIIGGRVIPSFTQTALRCEGRPIMLTARPWLERLSIFLVAATALGEAVAPDSYWAGALSLLAALAVGARLAGWGGLQTGRFPILWILHVAYGALAAGFALKGLGAFVPGLPPDAGLHMLSAGAIGAVTLAMMTRVSLGHTGRPLRVHGLIVGAYGLLMAGAALRVASPLLPERAYMGAVHLSGGFWALAFVFFLVIYTPILLNRRAEETLD